jgi:hypothetical protein
MAMRVKRAITSCSTVFPFAGAMDALGQRSTYYRFIARYPMSAQVRSDLPTDEATVGA